MFPVHYRIPQAEASCQLKCLKFHFLVSIQNGFGIAVFSLLSLQSETHNFLKGKLLGKLTKVNV